jgi:hypothetical protein
MGLSDDTTLDDLEKAWSEREQEAQALAARFPATAFALRLYALEIRIKAIICERLSLVKLPNHCKIHVLDEVIIFTGLLAELDDPKNAEIRRNWDGLVAFARKQLDKLRYLPGSAWSPADLNKYLAALDDPSSGVWTWLSKLP